MNVIVFPRINYVHSPDGELLMECWEYQRCTQGLARTRIALACQRPEKATRKKPDVMI